MLDVGGWKGVERGEDEWSVVVCGRGGEDSYMIHVLLTARGGEDMAVATYMHVWNLLLLRRPDLPRSGRTGALSTAVQKTRKASHPKVVYVCKWLWCVRGRCMHA